eukprot:GHVH01000462.1.p1 GENE.GHVH01000462.1~~GHVH01000462.1.p1  ORF type:complete len:162 (-),score=19.56 GHVH01000462.1:108-593(-)
MDTISAECAEDDLPAIISVLFDNIDTVLDKLCVKIIRPLMNATPNIINLPMAFSYATNEGLGLDDQECHMTTAYRKSLYHFPNLFNTTHCFSNRRILTSSISILTYIDKFNEKMTLTRDQISIAEEDIMKVLSHQTQKHKLKFKKRTSSHASVSSQLREAR